MIPFRARQICSKMRSKLCKPHLQSMPAKQKRYLLSTCHVSSVNLLLADRFTLEIGRRPGLKEPPASRIAVFRRKSGMQAKQIQRTHLRKSIGREPT